MGKDVFGTERFECTQAGCACTSYLCQIDAMTEEERVKTVVRRERSEPQPSALHSAEMRAHCR